MIRSGLKALAAAIGEARFDRNLRVLLVSGAALSIASGLVEPMLPLYLRGRGLGPEQVGMVFTCGSLLPILLQPILGTLSDRFNRKTFIFVSSASGSLLLPFLALMKNPVLLAAGLGARMTLGASTAPLADALVADLTPPDRRATIFALLDSSRTLLFVVMLAASGLLAGWLLPRQILLLAGAVYLVSTLSILFLRDPRTQAAEPPARTPRLQLLLEGLRSPLRYLGRPVPARLLAYQLCFGFALSAFPIYMPLYVVELGAPRALVGPILASSWLVYALVQPWAARRSDRSGKRQKFVTAGLLGMAVLAALAGLAQQLPAPYALAALVTAWVLIAIPDGMFRASAEALVLELTPEEERGSFLGSLGSAGSLSSVVAPLSYGLLAQRFGMGTTFLLSALFLLGARAAMAGLPGAALQPVSVPVALRSEASSP